MSTKRLILCIVVLFFIVFFVTRREPTLNAQNSCLSGDINADGKINLTDYELFKRAYKEQEGGGGPTQTPGAKIPANPKIMPLGDSLTVGMHGAGADWEINHSKRGGYRQKLEELLAANGTSFNMVGSVNFPDETMTDKDHEGHGGWCISGGNNTCFGDFSDPGGNAGLLAHIDDWMTAYTPDVVLLNIGTNDFNGGNSGNAAANYGQLIDKILGKNPNVFLFVSNINIQGNGSVPAFNSQVQQLAQQKSAGGKHVIYVDVWAGMTAPLHEGTDTLHPTLAGYEVMGQNWFNAMKPYLGGGAGITNVPPTNNPTNPPTGGNGPLGLTGNFTSVFDDEFDSYKSANWTRTYPWDTSGVERRDTDGGTDQIIDPANVTVSGGTVKLTFKKLPAPETINGLTREWSTGMMHTRDKVTFDGDARGTFIEIRSKPAKGNGLWSHLWLMPTDFALDPNCPVQRYTLKMHSFNGHYPDVAEFNVRKRLSCTISATSMSDDGFLHMMSDHTTAFHTYGMDWYPDHVDFYFDGQKVKTSTAIAGNSGPGFLIINGYVTMVGVNGRTEYPWDSRPDANTPTLTNFEVDYVRVWKRT